MKKIRCLLAGLITGVLLFTSVNPVSAANGAGSITFSAEETSVDAVGSSTAQSNSKVRTATSKAVTVKSKKVKKFKEQLTVWGVDKNGKTVWKYKTKAYPAAQCDVTLCVTKGSRVYVFEAGKVTALEKTTGKKIWVCKNITGGSQVAVVDDSGNVYVTGYLDTYDVYKVNSKGKRVWKTSMRKTGNYWAYKANVKSGKLTITYEANQSDPSGKRSHKVILKTGNGKILKYY